MVLRLEFALRAAEVRLHLPVVGDRHRWQVREDVVLQTYINQFILISKERLAEPNFLALKYIIYLSHSHKPLLFEIRCFHFSRYPSNSSILETIIDSSVYSLKISTPLGLIVIV